MGNRQIVLVSTAGFSVLKTGIFWREAKQKGFFHSAAATRVAATGAAATREAATGSAAMGVVATKNEATEAADCGYLYIIIHTENSYMYLS
jgi:hypothetical protein